ncbi:MAG: hypothetical protein JST00_00665 [Deltaproteobacteria bacterium]|nr:hypothetical protein [Deltaproteobacteria bacterium]
MHSSMARLCSIVIVLLGVSMAGCAAPVDSSEAGTTPVDDSVAAPGPSADDEKQPEEGEDVPPPATVAAGDVRPKTTTNSCTGCHLQL